jgi:hypothetical protein
MGPGTSRAPFTSLGAETGRSPPAYLQASWSAAPRDLLETTDRTVATAVGHQDPGTFVALRPPHRPPPEGYRAASAPHGPGTRAGRRAPDRPLKPTVAALERVVVRPVQYRRPSLLKCPSTRLRGAASGPVTAPATAFCICGPTGAEALLEVCAFPVVERAGGSARASGDDARPCAPAAGSRSSCQRDEHLGPPWCAAGPGGRDDSAARSGLRHWALPRRGHHRARAVNSWSRV